NHSVSNASFGLDAIACQGSGFACGQGASAGSCQVSEIEGFERFCVYSDSATSCPSGPYNVKQTLYTGMTGQWACPSCECEVPDGECTAFVNGYSGQTCGSDEIVQPFNAPSCFAWSADEAVAFRASNFGAGSFSCAPTEANPAPSNTPVLQGMRTYCCLQ